MTEKADRSKRAVAYYRSTTEEGDESIESQREEVRKWAEENGVEIIREFVDAKTTDRHTKRRPAYQEMMSKWVNKRSDFDYVLCVNASRRGRFKGMDLSASYSAECLKAGKRVVYTIIGMAPEDAGMYSAYRLIHRRFNSFRCCQYGAKVELGRRRAVEKGYWGGGNTPYGMRRLLLDQNDKPLRLLEPRERKTKQKHRVALVAGTPAEVATIRRIFHQFVNLGYSTAGIAKGLNAKRIPSPGGGVWKSRHVLACLRNEAYAKPIAYRRKKVRGTSRRGMTQDQWVHTPKASKGLVGLEQFRRAQEMSGANAASKLPSGGEVAP